MSHRIVELADGPALLHVKHSQLVIEREGCEAVTTPLEELAVLVLTHPRVQLTQSVIAGISALGGTVVICDSKYLPTAMLLPLQANFVQTERYAKQAEASEPLRKRLWQQLVQAKIRAQARALEAVQGGDSGLRAMAERVRSGDVENLEAQAARRYWPLLFRDPYFRRGNEGPNQNNHLNYGYAILRGVVARATCAAGLHPSFGLNHHNRYNPFCLADDLMEPFRPLVDLAVARWVEGNDPAEPLTVDTKRWILEHLLGRFQIDGEERTLFDCAGRLAASVVRAIMLEIRELNVPELVSEP
jgi:CRISPR-associated protein Cas1